MLGIYTRLSKDDPDSSSPENQLREGKLFFEKNNKYRTNRHYDEGIGVSGGLSINERPALKKLVDDIQSGLITAVWMRNQDRLERDTLTFHLFANIASSNNIDVYFGDNPKVDYNNPDSILQGTLMSAFNAYKRQKQGYDTKRTLKDNMKEGLVHAVIPYGYRKDDNRKMIIDENEAKTVRKIFRWSLEGKGYKSIADELNESKIKTRYANLEKGGTYKHIHKKTGEVTIRNKKDAIWNKVTIRGIIKNEVYKGIRKTKSGEIYPVDSIIQPYLFDKVGKNLLNNMTGGVKKNENDYLLNTINTCGVCGKGFNGRVVSVGTKYRYYQCVTKRNGKQSCGNLALKLDVLDKLIWEIYFQNNTITELLNNEYNFYSLGDENLKIHKEIQVHENEVQTAIDRKKDLVNMVLDKKFKASQVQENMDDLENKIYELQSIIFDKKKTMDEIGENLRNIVQDFNQFDNISKVKEFEDKQIIIQKYIKEINVTKIDKKHTVVKVDFKAPNIESDFILIDRLYHWYSEPLRNKITSLKGKALNKEIIEKEIKSYNIKKVKKEPLPSVSYYDPYTHTVKKFKPKKHT